jgi:hypothetical protein
MVEEEEAMEDKREEDSAFIVPCNWICLEVDYRSMTGFHGPPRRFVEFRIRMSSSLVGSHPLTLLAAIEDSRSQSTDVTGGLRWVLVPLRLVLLSHLFLYIL